jgi:tRNA(fMet)-specific endonuclease VapC
LDGFLLDTGVLSALFDTTRPLHATVRGRIIAAVDAPKYVSVVSIGELRLGIELAANEKPELRATFEEILSRVLGYADPIVVTKHTAEEYGRLKATLAVKLLNKAIKREARPRWVEEWTDHVTGKKLQADENDLWLGAQAIERNLVLLTTDRKLGRIAQYSSRLKLEIIVQQLT